MIELNNISKTFETDTLVVNALKKVDLKINKGEIFGVIGYSGAGKSTLVRCINLLERPSSGQVLINGEDITLITEKQLQKTRQSIGMIFQQFNLMRSRTVFENVAFPLRNRKIDKQEINRRVSELLELVGIEDKAKAYPSQLSGGQKQRVAIARALANNPDILLCDEATSALDPETTQSILKLLKEVNEKLGITMVVITHEMAVVKEICDRVAVMESGNIVEVDSVAHIFSNPKETITKHFINSTTNVSKIQELVDNNLELIKVKEHQKLLKISFSGSDTKEAIISQLSKKFSIEASIIFANVEIIQEHIIGVIVVILDGNTTNQNAAINFLKEKTMEVEVLNHE